ncbi:MAG: transporter [Alphaproteobacteria bacterium]|nr:transporter [Alphaproteobacteria bacterium]
MMKMLKMVSLGSLLVCSAMEANASGFQLLEYSATGLGRSYAGAGLVGDDYSAIAFNPAGMSLNDSGAQMGFTVLNIKNENKGTLNLAATGTPVPGTSYGNREVILNTVIPHVFGQYKLNEKTRLGLGVYAPFGLSTNYHEDWVGAIHAIDSKVQAIDVTPSLSYDVNSNFSFGLGVNFQKFDAKLTQYTQLDGTGFSKVTASDFGVGYNLGLMYKKDAVKLGVSYRSRIKHKLTGDHKLEGSTPILYTKKGDGFAYLTTPESLIFSGVYETSDKLTLSAMAKWTKWSRFDTLTIQSELLASPSITDEHWKNTWFYSLGADYKYDSKLTLRSGIGYDETPINGADHRTARIPDNNRVWLSAGFSYQYTEAMKVDVGYTYMFVHDSSSRHQISTTQLEVKYHTRAHLFGLQAQYKF